MRVQLRGGARALCSAAPRAVAGRRTVRVVAKDYPKPDLETENYRSARHPSQARPCCSLVTLSELQPGGFSFDAHDRDSEPRCPARGLGPSCQWDAPQSSGADCMSWQGGGRTDGSFRLCGSGGGTSSLDALRRYSRVASSV